MCGIVGYVGPREAVSVLIPALRRLEYRGYDSAGVATLDGRGFEVCKAAGRITRLESRLGAAPPRGRLGIAHTRWATHGRPSDSNAHPHFDCHRKVAVVHNGIVENYREIRRSLAAAGHEFRSETDSEVIAHLVEEHLSAGLIDAVRLAARELRGSVAIVCIATDEPQHVVALRKGHAPLVVGRHGSESFVASDMPALIGETEEFVALDDGGMAILAAGSIQLETLDGDALAWSPTALPWDAADADKGGHPHFMLKEILEQPDAIRSTLADHVDPETSDVRIPELSLTDREMSGLHRLLFLGCGTSWHAGLIGKWVVESLARLPVDVELASEFRAREPILDSRALVVPISQSGETADTLAATHEAQRRGARTTAICNVVGSSLARESAGVVYTRAGLEIGVASTKAFTTQVVAVTLLAIRLGVARGFLEEARAREIARALAGIPDLITRLLDRRAELVEVARRLVPARHALVLGRGILHPLALEGALKLKEISYIHAEGYAAGEMKHGPIALIDPYTPVLALVPRGESYARMMSNVEEVRARGAAVLALATEGDDEIEARSDVVIPVPDVEPALQPLLFAIPLQLLAYHTGVLRGCDVDKPRHLAKSVTVE
jgi:glucosamine--fructose-6-phosphate aminotransferase (isomerizing)